MALSHRVGRKIAARFLSYWRNNGANNPRVVTADKAYSAFRHWEETCYLRQWPRRELDMACDAAVQLITGRDPGHESDFLLRVFGGHR